VGENTKIALGFSIFKGNAVDGRGELSAPFLRGASLAHEGTLAAGEFTILAMTFEPNQLAKFKLTVFADKTVALNAL